MSYSKPWPILKREILTTPTYIAFIQAIVDAI